MVSEETKEAAKEEARKGLGLVMDGFIVLFKLIMILITSFFRAITIDFFHNIKNNWRSAFKKGEKKEEPKEKKKEEKPEEEKPKEEKKGK